MMTVNTSANIAASLSTLTVAQLKKELAQVRSTYQGEQIRYLPESELARWDKHIDLIVDEIDRRVIPAKW